MFGNLLNQLIDNKSITLCADETHRPIELWKTAVGKKQMAWQSTSLYCVDLRRSQIYPILFLSLFLSLRLKIVITSWLDWKYAIGKQSIKTRLVLFVVVIFSSKDYIDVRWKDIIDNLRKQHDRSFSN